MRLIRLPKTLEAVLSRGLLPAEPPLNSGQGKQPLKWLTGLVSVLVSIAIVTAVGLLLEPAVENYNLVLLFVLAVVVTGLWYGIGFAVLASTLAFLSFNFFLVDPRFSFKVEREEEWATLLFLLLIALACGPAASLIRRQFMLLKEANRQSEAMRGLAQQLSVADQPEAVWQATACEIGNALQTCCCIVVRTAEGSPHCYCSGACAAPTVGSAEWERLFGGGSDTVTDQVSAQEWSVYPLLQASERVATALVQDSAAKRRTTPKDRDLVAAMLRQGAGAWRRIQLSRELSSTQLKNEMEQLRSALLASVSHDLKSPLAAMMGAAESLAFLDKQLSLQDRVDLIDTILQESRRLESYIQNLLDMTRLGHGALKIERDWVSVTDIVVGATTRLKRYIPSIQTQYQEEGELPLLYVHAALIEQALYNILENAARFSPAGKDILISARKDNDACVISIEDQGPGIPEPERERIFDMFAMVSDGDHKREGTGMGLAICRGMIGAHGGSVRALPGIVYSGSRFVVELPLNVGQENMDGSGAST